MENFGKPSNCLTFAQCFENAAMSEGVRRRAVAEGNGRTSNSVHESDGGYGPEDFKANRAQWHANDAKKAAHDADHARSSNSAMPSDAVPPSLTVEQRLRGKEYMKNFKEIPAGSTSDDVPIRNAIDHSRIHQPGDVPLPDPSDLHYHGIRGSLRFELLTLQQAKLINDQCNSETRLPLGIFNVEWEKANIVRSVIAYDKVFAAVNYPPPEYRGGR
jgi:hypothetical protein